MNRLEEFKEKMRWTDYDFEQFINELAIEVKGKLEEQIKCINMTGEKYKNRAGIERAVDKYLYTLGILQGSSSYRYTRETIIYCIEKDIISTKIAEVFTEIAKQNDVQPLFIKRSIDVAIDEVIAGDSLLIREVLINALIHTRKLTPELFIVASVKYIKEKIIS